LHVARAERSVEVVANGDCTWHKCMKNLFNADDTVCHPE
jgi:hypothetical protein